nr:MAG TPA: hypothetical protein [Caudoviricetes sp.]
MLIKNCLSEFVLLFSYQTNKGLENEYRNNKDSRK